MPELPEVESVRSGLEALLTDKPLIKRVRLYRGDIRFPIPKNLPSRLAGQPIVSVRRRAKYLLIDTPEVSLLSHLGMTGSWRIEDASERREQKQKHRDPHDHCDIELSDGRCLVFRDPRRFGMIDLVEKNAEQAHPRLKGLGVEPLDARLFTPEYLFQASRRRKIAVKVFLMDQKIVVGVGNIYASEVLFRARVRPTRAAGKITRDETVRIVDEIRVVLREAIKAGGSSIRDFHSVGGANEVGSFQNAHHVYGKAGRACPKCGALIRTRMLGGRSTFWCPACQK
jgi:formamidopyrimidine-DNA glycosylase